MGISSMSGAAFGGYIGANIALEKGVAWVKLFLTVVVLVTGINFIFF
jgi:uncharacterized membrane protein YfcA